MRHRAGSISGPLELYCIAKFAAARLAMAIIEEDPLVDDAGPCPPADRKNGKAFATMLSSMVVAAPTAMVLAAIEVRKTTALPPIVSNSLAAALGLAGAACMHRISSWLLSALHIGPTKAPLPVWHDGVPWDGNLRFFFINFIAAKLWKTARPEGLTLREEVVHDRGAFALVAKKLYGNLVPPEVAAHSRSGRTTRPSPCSRAAVPTTRVHVDF